MATTNEDPFDDVLNLEDKFYSEGYAQGVADGERAGRIEGRAFGIEKGFEKFVEAGRLYGKAIVWANRLASSPPAQTSHSTPSSSSSSSSSAAAAVAVGVAANSAQDEEEAQKKMKQQEQELLLPRLTGSRLEKNVVTLHALVEPDTLATENTDEAVNDFDDRVKRAQGKARVIERQVGEDGTGAGANKTTTTTPPPDPPPPLPRSGGMDRS